MKYGERVLKWNDFAGTWSTGCDSLCKEEMESIFGPLKEGDLRVMAFDVRAKRRVRVEVGADRGFPDGNTVNLVIRRRNVFTAIQKEFDDLGVVLEPGTYFYIEVSQD